MTVPQNNDLIRDAALTFPSRPPLSRTALAGFISSLIFCVPAVASLAGLVLSILGLRSTRGGRRSGRGFAIAGLIVSIAGLLLWAVFGYFIYGILANSEPARQAARTFVAELAAGDAEAALAVSDPQMPREDINAAVDYLAGLGPYRQVDFSSINVTNANGTVRWTLGGTVTFQNGNMLDYRAIVRKTNADAYLVESFRFQ